ncbi:MAG: radical SAM family heme chaperone HemW [Desulfomonile tiedjei]|nr:radical SAM family heme chaperone HemW [Desulfomonile tiedjei]
MKSSNPVFPNDDGHIGIYVHVPFCLGRCNYCAFVTNPHDAVLEERYIRSVIKELGLWKDSFGADPRLSKLEADTIYFGGGTPSLLKPDLIAELIEACRSAFRISPDSEVTIEMNPATVTRAALSTLRRAGVNRVSLGIQSLDDAELEMMGRRHTSQEALKSYEDLRSAGFDNVSIDLIAGFPGQSRESVRATLSRVLRLRPEHLSVYLLEVKSATHLDAMIRAGKIPGPDEDLAADMYEDVREIAQGAGLEHYEISNFALAGYQSRHNMKYWQDQVFLGLGMGAHGMTGRDRYANVATLADYEAAVNAGNLPFESSAALPPEVRFKDALIMGLRLVKGMDLAVLGRRYGVDAVSFVMESIGDLSDAGLFVFNGAVLSLTDRGRLLSNTVFSRWV